MRATGLFLGHTQRVAAADEKHHGAMRMAVHRLELVVGLENIGLHRVLGQIGRGGELELSCTH
ncbi:hypothetical protein LP419_09600 [Massilia sp. H-1]|nr:hypothetical protein LP419_09600 [Massilia sp. H-1]